MESLNLFRDLIKKWAYGPHKSARAFNGPDFKPKCFIANWMKESLATEYISIDQIRESIDKAVNNVEYLCDCPQKNDKNLSEFNKKTRNSIRVSNF